MTQLEEARLDKLDRDAEAIETHLYGPSAALLTKEKRRELKASLASIYADMGKCVNRMIGRGVKP